jgi:hypothetical protein
MKALCLNQVEALAAANGNLRCIIRPVNHLLKPGEIIDVCPYSKSGYAIWNEQGCLCIEVKSPFPAAGGMIGLRSWHRYFDDVFEIYNGYWEIRHRPTIASLRICKLSAINEDEIAKTGILEPCYSDPNKDCTPCQMCAGIKCDGDFHGYWRKHYGKKFPVDPWIWVAGLR